MRAARAEHGSARGGSGIDARADLGVGVELLVRFALCEGLAGADAAGALVARGIAAVGGVVHALAEARAAARSNPNDPIRALARKVHARSGSHPSVSAALRAAIIAQHRSHPR